MGARSLDGTSGAAAPTWSTPAWAGATHGGSVADASGGSAANPARRTADSGGRPPAPFIMDGEAAARLSSPRPGPSRRTTDGGDRTASGSRGPGDPAPPGS